VPVKKRYSRETIKAAGFEVEEDETESTNVEKVARDKQSGMVSAGTLVGTKEQLIYEYVFNSRDGLPAFEQSQRPLVRHRVVTQDVAAAVVAAHPEVAVVGSQPAIEYLTDLDSARAEEKAARRFLAPMTGVALDPDGKGCFPLFSHGSAAPCAVRCR
jgi:hypothetical protein